jgi:DNA helicase II / ATP-dependent DNA helicase PcrA
MMSRIEQYLQELNEPQREAVLENSAPLLVLAGAGSGKTRVITTKIAYAVDVLGYKPWEILAVTFTNKAATEMRTRVASMLPEVDVDDMQIRTFHSFGAWLLRRYGSNIGLANGFSIYDDEDSLSLLASCYPGSKKTELSPVAKAISLAKDMGLDPDSPDLADFRADFGFSHQFRAYEEKLHKVGNVDFADLIGRSIEVLSGFPEIADYLHNRFKVILVDEYQDSNVSQFNLLKLLVGPKTFICVVGDDDQSIYRFRGADVQNILSFPDVYPGTRIIKLEQNYRSTGKILAIAGEVIAHNKGRHPKVLWTANTEGSDCHLIYVEDERAEATRCANIIKSKGNYDGSAILYRTNAQSVAFEMVFAQMGIPYKVVGALRFYDREEVKDALALLYLLMNRSDIVNFRRMVNKPSRGLGEVSVEKVIELSAQRGIDLIHALKIGASEGLLSNKATHGATMFAALFDHADQALEMEGNVACLDLLINESSLLAHYRKQDDLNKTDKVDNLGTLISAVKDYADGREGLLAFLESLMLDPTTIGRKDPSKEPGVTLITMHNTKGLEFDRVFITGLEEGLFPGKGRESDEDKEEERRIFYVAITRSRKELFLMSCRQRRLWGQTKSQLPSCFIDEISPQKLVVLGSRPGLSQGNSMSDLSQGYGGYGALDEKRIRAGAYGKKTQTLGPGLHRGFSSGNTSRNSNIISITPKPIVPLATRDAIEGRSFNLGDRVYHDSYGEGEVQAIRVLRERQLVDVRFGAGKTASFFSDVAPLEKLAND